MSLASMNGALRPAFEALGCPLYLFSPSGFETAASVHGAAELKQRMLEWKVNCVHAHQTPSGLMALAAAEELGIPFVFTVHGTYYPAGSLRSILARASKVISVSKPVQAFVRQLGFDSELVPNGIDTAAFCPEGSRKLRESLGIREEERLLVYASRLAWGKARACDTLLRAMKDMRKYGWDKLHLAVIGDGPQLADLRRLADYIEHETGRAFIHIAGLQTDMADCYRAADAVIGTGRVALEALACGKPVLAIGNHGFFGWIEPQCYEEAWLNYFGDHGSVAGYSRYLFASQLADGLRQPDRLTRMGTEGRQWVMSQFRLDEAINRLLKLYAWASPSNQGEA